MQGQLAFINNLSFNEIAVILVLALLLFGPRRLPQMGRTLGKTLGQWRRGYYDLKRTFELEVEEADREDQRKEREKKRLEAQAEALDDFSYESHTPKAAVGAVPSPVGSRPEETKEAAVEGGAELPGESGKVSS